MHNDSSTRDARKCLMPDPERCGRSPKDITKERVLALDLDDKPELFARKVSLHWVKSTDRDAFICYAISLTSCFATPLLIAIINLSLRTEIPM